MSEEQDLEVDDGDERTFEAFETLADDLGGPLMDDAEWARRNLDDAVARGATDEANTWRRTYVRAALATVESLVWITKVFILQQLNARERLFTTWASIADFDRAELALLRDEEYRLDGRGSARTGSARVGFIENVKFVARQRAKLVRHDELRALSGPGMDALVKAKRVRDRLMHPRHPEDLIVSDLEIAAVDRALLLMQEIEDELHGEDESGGTEAH